MDGALEGREKQPARRLPIMLKTPLVFSVLLAVVGCGTVVQTVRPASVAAASQSAHKSFRLPGHVAGFACITTAVDAPAALRAVAYAWADQHERCQFDPTVLFAGCGGAQFDRHLMVRVENGELIVGDDVSVGRVSLLGMEPSPALLELAYAEFQAAERLRQPTTGVVSTKPATLTPPTHTVASDD